jgi:hypothetical protein
MSFTTRPDASTPEPGLHMGRDHVAPHDTTATAGTAVAPPLRGPVPLSRRLLAGAALAAPLLLSLQYALDTAGLPREDPATYLGALAEAPGRNLASTCVYIVGMACLLAAARIVALGCGRAAPRTARVAAVLMSLGALGGMGFAGLRLTALALVEDGSPVPGSLGIWARVQEGAPFDVLSILLAAAILGFLTGTAAMWIARRDVTAWAAPLNVLGFVLASGEFPVAISVLGGLVSVAATWPVVVAALRRSC